MSDPLTIAVELFGRPPSSPRPEFDLLRLRPSWVGYGGIDIGGKAIFDGMDSVPEGFRTGRCECDTDNAFGTLEAILPRHNDACTNDDLVVLGTTTARVLPNQKMTYT